MEKKVFHKFGFTFVIPAVVKNKKYSVYYDDIYLTSFGQLPYEQYEDKIGYYRDLNHYDKKRRDNYRTRHRHDNISDLSSAGFWSWHFLW
jgi:hypothetical protein